MPFWTFIRNIFSGRNSDDRPIDHKEDTDNRPSFQNSLWQNDADDFRDRVQIEIFDDPLETIRLFEFQTHNILKNFVFGFNNKEDHNHFENADAFISPQAESLRSKMLKSDNATIDKHTESRRDTDLDGIITTDNFSDIWNQYNEPTSSEVIFPHQRIIGKSMRKEYIQKPDGMIEQKQVFRDSEGNEETVVSQQIGDKIYTVSTRRDKNGMETKTETFVNVDESEIRRKEWLPSDNENNFLNLNLNHFPWLTFFKPDPKLK